MSYLLDCEFWILLKKSISWQFLFGNIAIPECKTNLIQNQTTKLQKIRTSWLYLQESWFMLLSDKIEKRTRVEASLTKWCPCLVKVSESKVMMSGYSWKFDWFLLQSWGNIIHHDMFVNLPKVSQFNHGL